MRFIAPDVAEELPRLIEPYKYRYEREIYVREKRVVEIYLKSAGGVRVHALDSRLPEQCGKYNDADEHYNSLQKCY